MAKLDMQKNPHAVELGRLGGKRKSEKKAEAARRNGAKGGKAKTKNNEKISNKN